MLAPIGKRELGVANREICPCDTNAIRVDGTMRKNLQWERAHERIEQVGRKQQEHRLDQGRLTQFIRRRPAGFEFFLRAQADCPEPRGIQVAPHLQIGIVKQINLLLDGSAQITLRMTLGVTGGDLQLTPDWMLPYYTESHRFFQRGTVFPTDASVPVLVDEQRVDHSFRIYVAPVDPLRDGVPVVVELYYEIPNYATPILPRGTGWRRHFTMKGWVIAETHDYSPDDDSLVFSLDAYQHRDVTFVLPSRPWYHHAWYQCDVDSSNRDDALCIDGRQAKYRLTLSSDRQKSLSVVYLYRARWLVVLAQFIIVGVIGGLISAYWDLFGKLVKNAF